MNKMCSKLSKNVISGVLKQAIATLYGLILPNLILKSYGSEANGLVHSVTQFLGIISYLELGMGTVVQASLYSPLADKDDLLINQIMTSAHKFFSVLGKILLVYSLGLAIIYPLAVKSEFDYWYIAVIVLALSINSFGQYYFGIVDSTLLRADQKSYIYDSLSVVVYILSTIVGALLIYAHASLQLVEFVTSVIFLIRPVVISIYVKRNYSIDSHVHYDSEPIKQKWNGIAQHVCAIIIDGTDVIVLTLFSTLYNVSIYSVYNLVVTGVKSLVLSSTHGISAHLGNLIAGGDKERLQIAFGRFEWMIHTISIIVFGCTAVLIAPFVMVYTKGVTDIDYTAPLFAVLITIAQMFRCLRLPYNCAILAAGHFKQTQNNYIIASIINVVVSILFVSKYGLIGVAVGTIAAFLYQNVWMAWYISKNIVEWPFCTFMQQCLIDVLVAIPAYYLSKIVQIPVNDYWAWLGQACIVGLIWLGVSIIVNCFFKREMMISFLPKAFQRWSH